MLVRHLLGSVGVRCAAHLNEVDQAPEVISPVEPTLADLDKNMIFRVSDDNEPLCESQMSARCGAKGPPVVWIVDVSIFFEERHIIYSYFPRTN